MVTRLRKVHKFCTRQGLQEVVVSFTRSSDIIRTKNPGCQAYGSLKFFVA